MNNFIGDNNNIIDKNPISNKTFPNYQKQLEEINLLKNSLHNKIRLLGEESNFIIQIDIKGNSTEEPIKKFKLEIYLNYDYPEKPPDFKIYEINNKLTEEGKNIIKNKLIEYCNQNIGKPVISKLYEICK